MSLDDLALLLLVAEGGSLTEAAKASGVPLPTLSRRMGKLETASGKVLFLRGRAGYALSDEGRALAREVADLAAIRRKVSRWQTAETGPRRVRITAGFWTSRLLANTLKPDPDKGWLPEFVPSNAPLDLARREADIGIRNKPADHPWLARQRIRRIDYAVYGQPGSAEQYVTLPDDVPLPPSQRWVHQHHATRIATTARDTRLCLDLALSGFGRIVLPTFVGRTERGLTQLEGPIDGLSHDEWLVSHNEARNDPPIRAALDAVNSVLDRSAALRPRGH
ncbi:LysR family transcriptional regulator [Pacificoceanicola onchidii]|uniref:LysR family transcriptional regulator n=1 Tax=Pacificoceanicola onchidii TaxID=2562685 RepID=UPI001F0D4CD1|nr:LysR family transcriptional regulator [Pacificoceanicola onchidii]